MNTLIRGTMTSRPGTGTGGFTLIEVIIALAILTIGILSVNAMQTMAIRGNKTASDITRASTWASDQIERIVNMPYDDLVDTNGNGNIANQDQNSNNIDDDDEGTNRDGVSNFGLDNPAVFDGTAANDPDGNFTIVWNVSENMPLPNIKTFHVHVTWQAAGTTRSVTIRHTKSKYM